MDWVQTTVLLPAEISLPTAGKCPRCSRHVIPQRKWATIKTAVRKQLRKEFAELCSRGLCRRCYMIAQKDGTLIDYERRDIPNDIFVEEYRTLHGSGATQDHIREVLNMTQAAFDMALRRAKKRGDL